MRHIPNILSAFRIVLIPLFVWQMYVGNPLYAAAILAVSGLTDLLDGMLARKFGWISAVGKVLDPAADKLTQVTVCVVMAIVLHRYWPFFAILLLKDFVMLVLGGHLLKKGVKLEGAKWFGKVVTFMFYIVMLLILFFPGMPSWLQVVLLGVVSICAVGAAIMYIPEYIKYRKSYKEQQ